MAKPTTGIERRPRARGGRRSRTGERAGDEPRAGGREAARGAGRTATATPGCLVVRDLGQLRALADPLRLRILEGFAAGPQTAKQVAQRIGERPGKLYHHVAVLEGVGLLAPTHTRQVRGTIEKYFRAAAARFEVDGALLSAAEPEHGPGAERAALISSLLAQTRSELLDAQRREGGKSGRGPRPFLARMVVRCGPERVEKLLRRLQSEIGECARPQARRECGAAGARSYALTLACSPLADGPAEERESAR